MATKTKAESVDQVGRTPRDLDVKSVFFACHAPGAGLVQLVGSFTEWAKHPIAMSRGGETNWEAAAELPPGRYEYKFLIDGEWSSGEPGYDDRDSACPNCTPNPYGTFNRVVEVN